jgi:predicted amino acid racemase
VVGVVRPTHLERARELYAGKLMMLQLPDLDQVAVIKDTSDIWLVSDPAHARMIATVAKQQRQIQELILMVDVGNHREGVIPELTVATAAAIMENEGVSLIGLGTTVGCYCGYKAGLADMEYLVDIAIEAEAQLGCRFDTLSVGSGSMLLELAEQGEMPDRINQLRIGAAVLVGEEPPTRRAIPGLFQDAFIFQGKVLETSLKPSTPEGSIGTDAFGNKIVFEHQGLRRLCILNFGLLDVDSYDLTPLTEGLRIIAAASNYTICDTTDCDLQPAIGDTVEFRMAYSSMARAMVSRDVKQVFITDVCGKPC